MALIDGVAADDETLRWVTAVDAALHDDSGRFEDDFGSLASDRGGAVEDAFESVSSPPLGVHAVGLAAIGGRWTPVLVVMAGLAPDATLLAPLSAATIPHLSNVLDEVGEIPADYVGVIGIEQPMDQYTRVAAHQVGTAGMPVICSDGTSGVLTAGHVAKDRGANATLGDGLRVPATVIYTDSRSLHGSGVVCADVAVLQPVAGWREVIRTPRGLKAAPPTLDGTVRLHALNRSGTGGTAPGQIVRVVGDRFFVDETSATWGEFMLVDPVSIPGDSGSLVVAQDGSVAGQVVGGLPGAYSIVQDMRYLLAASSTSPDLD